MRHTNVLAVLYFVSGYFAVCALLFTTELHLQALGGFLLIYLTYMLVEQLER
tara:strand:- start:131 stop:286 length:156 start_codon:yes stop_codon:yes gene_type:complete